MLVLVRIEGHYQTETQSDSEPEAVRVTIVESIRHWIHTYVVKTQLSIYDRYPGDNLNLIHSAVVIQP